MIALDTTALENHFNALATGLPARLALRTALRVMPILSARDSNIDEAFEYWPKSDHARHMFALFRACAVASCVNASPRNGETAIAFPVAAKQSAAAIYAAESAASAAITKSASCVGFAIAFSASSSIILTSAGGAAAFAIDNAVEAATPFLSTAYTAFTHDLALLNQLSLESETGDDPSVDMKPQQVLSMLHELRGAPLWAGGIPDEAQDHWTRLQDDLINLDAGFTTWIDWYRDQLEGHKSRLEWERNCLMLAERQLSWPVARLNEHLDAPEAATTAQDETAPDTSLQTLPVDSSRPSVRTLTDPPQPPRTAGSDLADHATLPDLLSAMRFILTSLAHEAANANVEPCAVHLIDRIAGLIPRERPTAVDLFLLSHAHLVLLGYEKDIDDKWPRVLAHKLSATTLMLGQLIALFPSWRAAVNHDGRGLSTASDEPLADATDIWNRQLRNAIKEAESDAAEAQALGRAAASPKGPEVPRQPDRSGCPQLATAHDGPND
ncbi:MAG: hypothetical protein ACR2PA_10015 [Hyphomicrobiaceae bacterium]